MTQSIYQQYIDKLFPNYVASVVERLDGRSLQNQIPFLFNELLNPEYSADARWASIVGKYENVSADIVALGSSTPKKSRDILQTYMGDIPKIAVKRELTEQDMKAIDSMIERGLPLATIVNRIFADVPFVINAIDERIEDLFLSMLSTGVGRATNNIGQGVNFDMHYFTENKFGAKAVWSGSTAKPMDDITRLMDKAENDGNSVRYIFADNTALNWLYNNEQVRGLFGFQQNYVGGGANVPALSFDQLSAMFMSRFGIELRRVSRSTRTEVNGQRTTHKAWADGRLVFTCDAQVGSLVYTPTAEENHQSAGATYTKANAYTLVSKFSDEDPVTEWTKAQAMVVPVINTVDRIYTLDPTQVQA